MGARARRGVGVLLLLAVVLAGCSARDPDRRPPSPGSGAGPSGDVTVFAAASLSDVFEGVGDAFEAAHPEVTVTLNFGGSSVLAEQLRQGATADVFAPADRSVMRAVEDGGLVTADDVFASNSLEIAVPAGNPAGVAGLGDFARPDLTVALCAADVPCGASARTAFASAGVTPLPDTLEQDVTSVLAKVRLGEVDAGVVYRTDVLAAGREVEGVLLPEEANVTNRYPIAPLVGAPNPDAAAAFVAFVLSDAARAIFEEAGFGAP